MKTLNPHTIKSSYSKHDKADHKKMHYNQIPENQCEGKVPEENTH